MQCWWSKVKKILKYIHTKWKTAESKVHIPFSILLCSKSNIKYVCAKSLQVECNIFSSAIELGHCGELLPILWFLQSVNTADVSVCSIYDCLQVHGSQTKLIKLVSSEKKMPALDNIIDVWLFVICSKSSVTAVYILLLWYIVLHILIALYCLFWPSDNSSKWLF